MKKNIFLIILISVLSFILLTNCNKKQEFGFEVLPEEDKINSKILDTFSINVYTVESEHLNTGGVTKMLIGSYIDPIFGYSEASFCTQILQTTYPNFPDTLELDSIFLTLPFEKDDFYYGELHTSMNIFVYELSDTLVSTSKYYSDEDPNDYHENNLLGSDTYTYSAEDTCMVIRLDDAFGQLLIDEEDAYFESYGTPFTDIFKGIYVTTEGSQNQLNAAIYKLDLSAPNFNLTIHYHSSAYQDSLLTYIMPINSYSARFNIFEHDYSNTDFYEQLTNPFTILDSVAYIQAMAGTKIRIDFPYLSNLNEYDNLVINKAEIVLKTASASLTFENDYLASEILAFLGYDDEDKIIFFDDYYSSSTGLYSGCEYDEIEGEYRLNVTRIVQEIIDGANYDFDFYFVDRKGSFDFKRTVINTGNNSNSLKLVISYTEY